jgi:hypothetical protein
MTLSHWFKYHINLQNCSTNCRLLPAVTFRNSAFCPHIAFICFAWLLILRIDVECYPGAVTHWLLTAKSQVRARATSCVIRGERSCIGFGSSSSFFCFTLLIIIPPLLHVHLSPLPLDTCDSPDQAAHYHILGLYVGGFISEQIICSLQIT